MADVARVRHAGGFPGADTRGRSACPEVPVSAPARHLHAVDVETGERFDHCPECARRDDEIKGLQRSLAGESRRYEKLKRDKAAEARKHGAWPMGMILFDAWKLATGHKRSKWMPDRFWMVEQWLIDPDYGPEMCLRAIAGIAFDPYKTQQKNGAWERHDGWELCFRDTDHVERYANKAPKGWRDDPVFADALEQIKARTR